MPVENCNVYHLFNIRKTYREDKISVGNIYEISGYDLPIIITEISVMYNGKQDPAMYV